jgi:ABC-type Fe3+-hydroxamate transport system substrate-binding protein
VTQTLLHLGLDKSIVGVTDYCPLPDGMNCIDRVGGVKDPDVDKVISLEPDIVFADVEENTKDDADRLSLRETLFVTSISDTGDVKRFLRNIGRMFNRERASEEVINGIERVECIIDKSKQSFSFAYLVWKEPYIVCSDETYISSLIEMIGGKNIFQNKSNLNYYQVTINDIKTNQPDVIFLPNEPYDFTDREVEILFHQLGETIPRDRIINVDGYIINWWGIKTPEAILYLSNIVKTVLGNTIG